MEEYSNIFCLGITVGIMFGASEKAMDGLKFD